MGELDLQDNNEFSSLEPCQCLLLNMWTVAHYLLYKCWYKKFFSAVSLIFGLTSVKIMLKLNKNLHLNQQCRAQCLVYNCIFVKEHFTLTVVKNNTEWLQCEKCNRYYSRSDLKLQITFQTRRDSFKWVRIKRIWKVVNYLRMLPLIDKHDSFWGCYNGN